ncbi:MAG: molybdopterin-binding protein [Pseudomonadota bacterium]
MNRRRFLRTGLLGGGSALLSGCQILDGLMDTNNATRRFMEKANRLTMVTQRSLIGPDALAPEFTRADIRQGQKPNGVIAPTDLEYQLLAADGFRDYRLEVMGSVRQPLSLSLDQLRNMPIQTQITRHDCVEGWSCIAEWTGVPLARVLDMAGTYNTARYAVIHCMDTIEQTLSGGVRYYESIDMIDAWHPQTILAYGLNAADLPERNGAPLRLRVERQLGYKMAKYIRAIELTDSLSAYGRGKGGYWEDRGYEWYAGI